MLLIYSSILSRSQVYRCPVDYKRIACLFFSFSRVAFESVVRSMLSVGFSEDEIVSVVALLAGVILIGDIVSSYSNRIVLLLYTTNFRNVHKYL